VTLMERLEIKEFKGINTNVPCGTSVEPRRLFNLDLDLIGGYSPYGDLAESSYYPDFSETVAKDEYGLVTWFKRDGSSVCIKSYNGSEVCRTFTDRTGFHHIPGAGFLRVERRDTGGATYYRSASAFPSSGLDDNSIGRVAWSNPGNITAADSSYARAGMFLGYGGYVRTETHYLEGSNYGFAIPADAEIRGIEVIALVSGSNGAHDYDIRLIRNDGSGGKAIATGNKSRGYWHQWKNTGEEKWGGPDDLWGTSWTPAQINDALFGARISAHLEDWYEVYANVDAITIKVYYSTSGDDLANIHIDGVVVGESNNAYDLAAKTVDNTNTSGSVTVSGQRHGGIKITEEAGGAFAANPVFGIQSWVRAHTGRVAVGHAHVTVNTTSSAIKFEMPDSANHDLGADIYYFIDANTGWTYLGSIEPGKPLTVSKEITGPATEFKVFENNGPVTIARNRMVTSASSVGVIRTESQFNTFDFTNLDCVGVFDDGMHMINAAEYFPVTDEVTGLAPMPGGIIIYTERGAHALTGDMATAAGTRMDRYPSPVGNDKGSIPATFGSVVFSVWNGRVYAAEGGRAQEVSIPVYKPTDGFISIAIDEKANDLYAVTKSGKVFVYDPERQAWINGLVENALDVFPSPIGIYVLPNNGTFLARRIAYNATSITLTPEVEWCISPLPNQMAQFHRVYVPILEYDGVPKLEYSIDGKKASSLGRRSGDGRYMFRLNGGIGYTITMRLILNSARADTVIRPTVEVHAIPRRVIR